MAKADEEQIRKEIEAQLPEDIPVAFEDVFPKLKGMGVKRANRFRIECLDKATPLLRIVLEPQERVHVVSRARVNFFGEHFFMGWLALLVNSAILVATQKRILIIHTTRQFEPHLYVNEIPASAIKKVGGFFGSISLTLQKGRRSVSFVSKQDRQTLQKLFPKNSAAQGGVRHLCSSCFQPHDRHVARCERCHVEFKSPKIAAARSLALPGLGDWYIGHRNVALLEMVGSLFTWLIIIASLVATVTYRSFELLAGAAVLALVVNGFDAALTHWQARKGLMSRDGFLPSRNRGPRHPHDSPVPVQPQPIGPTGMAVHPGDKISVPMAILCGLLVVVLGLVGFAFISEMTDSQAAGGGSREATAEPL